MHTLILFLRNLFNHGIAWVGGALTVAPVFSGQLESLLSTRPKTKTLVQKIFKNLQTVAIICLLVACYLAWDDEHHNTGVVIAEKAEKASQANTCLLKFALQGRYAKGLESSNQKQQQNLEETRNFTDKQQGGNK